MILKKYSLKLLSRNTVSKMTKEKVCEVEVVKVFGVDSKTIVYKNIKPLSKCYLLVPKWTIYTYFLALFTLVGILAAAFTIVYQAPDPSNYQESCKGKSCNKGLNMKCINNICSCTSTQYFLNKCCEKKGNMESCSRTFQCQSGLTCRDAKCQCNDSYYYAKNSCVSRKSFDELCKDDQCMTNSYLYCNNQVGKCRCPSDRLEKLFFSI